MAATRQVLDRLGAKWSVRAVAALLRGPLGFVELRRELGCVSHQGASHRGVSHKVLSQVLRSLERDGYVSRRIRTRAPLRVEYRLTPLGLSFVALLDRLGAWAEAHMGEVMAHRGAYDANNLLTPDASESSR